MEAEPAVQAIEFEIDSRLENVSLLGAAIRGALATVGLGDGELFHWELCVVEAASNSVRHAYAGQPGHRVRVGLAIWHDRIEARIADSGTPMPAERRSAPPADPDADDPSSLAEGGRGLFLIHSLMDSVTYGEEGGCNTLTLVKARTAD